MARGEMSMMSLKGFRIMAVSAGLLVLPVGGVVAEEAATAESRGMAASSEKRDSLEQQLASEVAVLESLRKGEAVSDLVPVKSETYRTGRWEEGTRAFAAKLAERFASAEETTGKAHRTEMVGKPLPWTRFLGPSGGIVDLGEQGGDRRLMLVFMRGFGKYVCPGCTVQTAVLAENLGEFEKRKTDVVIVYPGVAESIPAYLEAIKEYNATAPIAVPVLLDIDLDGVKAFGIEGTLAMPATFIVGADGNVEYAYVGNSYDDRPSVRELMAFLDGKAPPAGEEP